MKYFRYYPFGLQLLLFSLMWFTLYNAAQFIILSLFTKMTGFPVGILESINPNSPTTVVNAAMIIEGLGNVLVYFLPGFLFAYLTHPSPTKYLGLKAPGKPIQLLIVVFVMIGAMPILQMIDALISQINFGTVIKQAQADNENMMNAFLKISSFTGFLKVFVLLAIIPAFGEELFFRGVLMRLLRKRSVNMRFPIISTALIFALLHFNIYGLLSIFLAGVLLAVIYNLTGSLWCNILGHMLFNGSQIILVYAGNSNTTIKTFMANNFVPYYLIIGGAIVFCISFYLLLKNKTPLPANWADDFTPEELAQNAD